MDEELSLFKGGMTENYVFIQLMISGFKTWYWRDEKSTKEVDFLITLDRDIIPIEVKSGERTGSDSLKDYVQRFKPAYSIRISEKNFGFDNGIKAVPLYAVFCIENRE